MESPFSEAFESLEVRRKLLLGVARRPVAEAGQDGKKKKEGMEHRKYFSHYQRKPVLPPVEGAPNTIRKHRTIPITTVGSLLKRTQICPTRASFRRQHHQIVSTLGRGLA